MSIVARVQKKVNMNVSEETERRMLTSLLEAAQEFYENPENRKAFEDWKNSDKGKQQLKLLHV